MAQETIDDGRQSAETQPPSVVDRLSSLKEHLVNGGRIERTGDVLRLVIPPTTSAAYTDAQLDDYEHELPHTFLNAPPQRLCIRARFSHPTRRLKGTAGFGFWNHPFTREGGVLAPPRNVWFFYSSPESNMQLVRGVRGNGFKAAMLDSFPFGRSTAGRQTTDDRRRSSIVRRLSSLSMKAASPVLNLALRSRLATRLAMTAARAVIHAREAMLDLDMTHWHEYVLDWLPDAAIFCVNGREILRAPKPPRGPMGFVAWVDNYRAAATPDGQYEFAYVDVPEEQWLELSLIRS